MKKSLLVVLSAFVLISLTPINSLYAQKETIEIKKNPHKGMFWEKLNLSKEQKDQIDKLRFAHQKEVIDLRAEIKKNRINIEELLKETKLDESKLRSLVNKNSELQAKLKESALNMWLKAYNVLDEKQKELWREHTPFLQEGRDRFKHRMLGHEDGMGNRERIIKKFRHGISMTADDFDIEENIED